MKKAITILLTLVMVLSLAACGGDSTQTDTPESQPSESVVNHTESKSGNESIHSDEYAIGEAFGTDNVECKVLSFTWITPEKFDSVSERTSSSYHGESVYAIDVKALFPQCEDSFGQMGGIKSDLSDACLLLVEFSLQNTGKAAVEAATEWKDSFRGVLLPYGTCVAIDDAGSEYEFGSQQSGFTTSLGVLADAVQVVGGCRLPVQVYENESKPLHVKVTLPNSSGEKEDFIVALR